MRYYLILLVFLLGTFSSEAQIHRLSLYFKEGTAVLDDSSDALLRRIEATIDTGTHEYQWIEVNCYAALENDEEALALAKERSQQLQLLLNVTDETTSWRILGNKKDAVTFAIVNWNRADLYYYEREASKQVNDFATKFNQDSTDFSALTTTTPERIPTTELALTTFNLQLFFYGNSTRLKPGFESELERLEYALNTHQEVHAEILGHVCCGNKQSLSRRRARVIYRYLIKRGIDKSRLSYDGYGNTRPLVTPEQTEKDRALNRRIEVIFSTPISENIAVQLD